MVADSRPAATAEIAVLNANRYRDVENEALRLWTADLVEELTGGDTGLAVRMVGDRAMRELNRRYRGRDRTTDVLSFPGETTPEGRHLGDIAISVPVARRQAGELGHSLDRELRCLILHGVLHCLGYDHQTDDGEMHRVELDLRARWIDRGEARP